MYNGNSKAEVQDYLSTIVSSTGTGAHNRDAPRFRWQAQGLWLAVRISLFVRVHMCGTFEDGRSRTLARRNP